MNLFFKQATRKPVFTVLMVLLLSLSIALSCIGFSAWTSVKKQREQISSGYTTVAIPKQPDLTDLSAEEIDLPLQKRVYADHAAQEAPQLAMIDRRCLLSAHIAGSQSLSSSSIDPSEYNSAFDAECYSLAVFALRCEDVTEMPTDGVLMYDAMFHIEEAVCLSDAYDCFPLSEPVRIFSDVCEEGGAIPFEKGKTYLVFGQYQDGAYQAYPELVPFPAIHSNLYSEPSWLETGTQNGGSYHYPAAGQIPWVAEYTGAVTDYLSSEAAAPWNEEIIPLCQLNHQSAAVILTDRVASMYSFNTGDASLLSGRFFTDEEYQTGAEVCIVSASYAELNNLCLGDTLRLDYYDSSYIEYSNGANVNSIFAAEDPGPFRQRCYMSPEDAIGVCKEYTIVGIYTGARFAFGAYHFNADTILAPKGSVPNAQEYEAPTSSLLNSFILKNGSAGEFERYMEQQELGGQFLYFDQDYASMQESLEALEANALRLLLVGGGVFLLISLLFLFLNFRRMNPNIRRARLLGRSGKTVFRETMMLLLLLDVLAILIGASAAAMLFGTVTEAVLSSSLAPQPEAILIASAAMLALQVLLSMISSAIFANRKLMKAK